MRNRFIYIWLAIPLFFSCSLSKELQEKGSISYDYVEKYKIYYTKKWRFHSEWITLHADGTFSSEKELFYLNPYIARSEGVWKKEGATLTLNSSESFNTGFVVSVEESIDTTMECCGSYRFYAVDVDTNFLVGCDVIFNNTNIDTLKSFESAYFVDDSGKTIKHDAIRFFYFRFTYNIQGFYVVKNPQSNVFKVTARHKVIEYYYFRDRKLKIRGANTLVERNKSYHDKRFKRGK